MCEHFEEGGGGKKAAHRSGTPAGSRHQPLGNPLQIRQTGLFHADELVAFEIFTARKLFDLRSTPTDEFRPGRMLVFTVKIVGLPAEVWRGIGKVVFHGLRQNVFPLGGRGAGGPRFKALEFVDTKARERITLPRFPRK